MIRYPAALLALLAGLACIAADESRGEDTGFVTLRATPALPDSIIEFVAQVSEPRYGEIRAGERPEAFVEAVCGHFSDTYAKMFFSSDINPNLVREPDARRARKVRVPACARWRNTNQKSEIFAHVRRTDTLDSILKQRIGRTSDQRLLCSPRVNSPRCNKIFRELAQSVNPGKNLDSLQELQKIVLPFDTAPATFRVRASSGLTSQQVRDRIKELASKEGAEDSIIAVEVAPPVWMLSPPSVDDDYQVCREASKTTEKWPYDAEAVSKVIVNTLKEMRSFGGRIENVNVTVMDTGLDDAFPREFLDRDVTVHRSLWFGRGAYRDDQIAPFVKHEPPEMRLHGTHVAEILYGGSGLRDAYPQFSDLFRLKIFNVVVPPTSVAGQYHPTSDALNRGMAWAARNSQVVNVSVGSQTELSGLRDAIKAQPNVLVVAAAGNEPQVIHQETLYPASFGGMHDEIGKQVISVAAHDGDLKPASFSSWSKQSVDIFAPGCDVIYKKGELGVHGTSFAAPLVAMTAAILRAFGVSAPHAVKQRLRASVDYDPKLDRFVVSSGRLNIAKALSVYHDVVERKSRSQLTFGKWEYGRSFEVCPDSGYDAMRIRKVVQAGANPLKVKILWTDELGNLHWEDPCEPIGVGLSFVDLDGKREVIPWAEVVDIVPAITGRSGGRQ